MQIYVDAHARKQGDGSAEFPFRTITEAANIAKAGDEVLVFPGIYREYVDPIYAGTEKERIVYRSLEARGAVITGAEKIKDWVLIAGTVWSAKVPNEIFGDYNPYTTKVFGDWFDASYTAHTGEVYLNGKSLYEVSEVEQVYHPKRNEKSWDADFTVYTWYTEQSEETNETIFYANFQGEDPNEENVEINVRRNGFYPSKEGVGYITLSGFVVKQAATQWAPPTAYQEGMVGPHWSKGWIIENCEISHFGTDPPQVFYDLFADQRDNGVAAADAEQADPEKCQKQIRGHTHIFSLLFFQRTFPIQIIQQAIRMQTALI